MDAAVVIVFIFLITVVVILLVRFPVVGALDILILVAVSMIVVSIVIFVSVPVSATVGYPVIDRVPFWPCFLMCSTFLLTCSKSSSVSNAVRTSFVVGWFGHRLRLTLW